jgi:hypothetical protein
VKGTSRKEGATTVAPFALLGPVTFSTGAGPAVILFGPRAGEDLHWIDFELVCSRLEYARENGLLACGPVPVRSVMLTHKAVVAARGKFTKSHRESG